MTTQPTLFDRFRTMPRIVQWGAYIAIGIVVFLIWSDYIAPVSREFKERADEIAADVRTVRDTAAMDRQIRAHEDIIRGVGVVQKPRPASQGEIALNQAVNEVVGEFTVTNYSYSMRVQGSLSAGALPGLTGGLRPQLLTGDLKFNATPDVTMAIIAKLESHPEIESLSTVRISRIAGRRVSAHIMLEAWVLPTDGARRGGSI